jgi:hypothetical protein
MIDTERLKKLWNGKTAFLQDGSVLYKVLTPNGKENPIFVPTTDESLYGATSGGFAKAPEPKTINPPPAPPKKQMPVKRLTKHSDVGG